MAYRRTERVEEQLQDKRDRILQAVRSVVAEVGFRRAQVAMVAAAAEVATGTVYRHFPSKGELFAARIIYRRAFSDVFEGLIREGMAGGEFPPQNAAASAACLMGALNEGLIGPLAPEAGDLPNTRALVDAITAFCLQAVPARPFASPSLRVMETPT